MHKLDAVAVVGQGQYQNSRTNVSGAIKSGSLANVQASHCEEQDAELFMDQSGEYQVAIHVFVFGSCVFCKVVGICLVLA